MRQSRANGAAIRAIRGYAGLEVSEVAAAVRDLGVPCTRDHLYNIELIHKDASMKLLVALAKVLKVPVTALLREQPEQEAS
jgi:transcriptional regulator with XRE-family HTH domain